MSLRLVPKSVTLNDLERRSGGYLRYFSKFGYLPGVLRKSSRSLSHLLLSSCLSFFNSPGGNSAHCLAVASVLIAPNICQGQRQTMYTQSIPNFVQIG